MHEREGDRARRVCRREQAAEGPAVGERDDQRALAACGVEDGAEVVDPLLDRRQAVSPQPIGEPYAALVVADDPAPSTEMLDELRHRGEAPEVREL